MTELETLEAQLADTRQREQLAVKMNLDLQQQVRELRKLLERHDTCSLRNSSTYARSSLAEATAAALRSAPPSAHDSALTADVAQSTPDRSPSRGVTGKEHLATNQEVAALGKQPSAVSAEEAQDNWERVCADDGFHFLKHACHDIFELLSEGQISIGKAAQLITERKLGLTSQLPSEWGKSSQALRDSTQHVHDENMQTDAGEERKDLAQGSDAGLPAEAQPPTREPAHGGAGTASEQVPAVRRRSCNRHSDCNKFESGWLARHPGAKSVPFNLHCHDEECEDCFGK